jgi:hypothetical protein
MQTQKSAIATRPPAIHSSGPAMLVAERHISRLPRVRSYASEQPFRPSAIAIEAYSASPCCGSLLHGFANFRLCPHQCLRCDWPSQPSDTSCLTGYQVLLSSERNKCEPGSSRHARPLSSLRIDFTGPSPLLRTTMFDGVPQASFCTERAIRFLCATRPTLQLARLPLSACGHLLALLIANYHDPTSASHDPPVNGRSVIFPSFI